MRRGRIRGLTAVALAVLLPAGVGIAPTGQGGKKVKETLYEST